MANISNCDDFLAFQETLKRMRKIDDSIIYALNTTIPTDSFAGSKHAPEQCKHLYGQLRESYDTRESAIKQCINDASKRVKSLKQERQSNENDLSVLKSLRKEQSRLRLMQNELNVEEVVKDRSLKVFYERCRQFYKPTDIKL